MSTVLAVFRFCVLLVAVISHPVLGQDSIPTTSDAKRAQSSEQTSSSGETQQDDEQQVPEEGYPVERERLVGGPTDHWLSFTASHWWR